MLSLPLQKVHSSIDVHETCRISYPIICKHLISFSILTDDEVGTRYLRATLGSGCPFKDAAYTELNVPVRTIHIHVCVPSFPDITFSDFEEQIKVFCNLRDTLLKKPNS